MYVRFTDVLFFISDAQGNISIWYIQQPSLRNLREIDTSVGENLECITVDSSQPEPMYNPFHYFPSQSLTFSCRYYFSSWADQSVRVCQDDGTLLKQLHGHRSMFYS